MGFQAASMQNAGPSRVQRIIRGTEPGLLDPTQPSRVLRSPDSKLSFASFDPRTALAGEDVPDLRKLFIGEDLPPPKRIVIETTPKGTSFWRFVPKARLEEGVCDEGFWPRVVEICGEQVLCYQEQWEIYKLDPEYQCTVHFGFKPPSIVKIDPQAQAPRTPSPPGPKRQRARTPTPEANTPLPSKRARSRRTYANGEEYSSDSESDEDEEEVEQMVVDDITRHRTKPPSNAVRHGREELKKERNRRWQRNRGAQERYSQESQAGQQPMSMDAGQFASQSNTDSQPEETTKRKSGFAVETDVDEMPQEHAHTNGHARKRQRTTSPAQVKPALQHSKIQRERRKIAKVRAMDQHHQKVFKRMFADLYPINVDELPSNLEEPPTAHPQPAVSQEQSESRHSEDIDEEVMRQAELEESIRRMRELERDRPLWEEQRRKREAHERAEEQERQAKAEQRRKAEAERQRQQREEAEHQARELRAEAERRAAEEERRQQEYRQRRQRQRWESGIWTSHRALERYRILSEEFDAARFTPDQSITFLDIPWPVLHSPSRLTVEDVDWSAVEKFFATVKTHMRSQDYKDFVERSHRRFHPDRWRARKLWSAVRDDVERSCLEVAANTVAQAITPIWREIKAVH